MKIILAGGTGFIGEYLVQYFSSRGHEIVILTRAANKPDGNNFRFIHWDGETRGDWFFEVDGADVVINLAGRSINCRYTEKNKKEIIDSRLLSTQIIGDSIRESKNPPKLWMNMSSCTIYENSENEPQDELSGKIGDDFSMNVCKDWEKTFYNSVVPHTRKIVARLSVVIGKTGGAITPFKNIARLGAGGKMASGKQMVSWIFIEDLARAFEFLIQNEQLSGIFNVTSPNAVSNKNFMKAVRKMTGIPFGIPSAAWMIRLGAFIIGTDPEFVLKSRWAIPKKLLDAGFKFQYADIQSALSGK